ncbi:YggT family protein [Thermosipho japonicus]|uniref:YggT family protein n=1 Tax=Thermosipho japonicus TaxID=90323 RepID=A0A841GVF0_9BACT|nr:MULTISPECIES: YggT family protein [Thermosipho]MBB6062971.1 YggT family protein [Thermosipho japonicus]
MFILGNFLIGLGYSLRVLINIEMFFIVISAILSWFSYNSNVQSIYYYFQSIADIIEKPIRKLIPRIGPVDISPMIAIVVLVFFDRFLIQSIIELGYYIK